MRLLIIHEHIAAPGLGGGGAETLMRDQMLTINQLGHQTYWWNGQDDLAQTIKTFKPDVCYIGTIHTRIGIWPAEYLQVHKIPHVWAIMDYYPFCVGANNLNCTVRMLLINKDQSCPAVDGKCPSNRSNYLSVMNKSHIVALNEYTADIYRRNGLRVDYIVEPGIDTDKFSPDYTRRKSLPRVYTSSAWVMPHKGVHILRDTGIHYEHISGVSREVLCDALKDADIFVFTSVYEETFGYSLCEAMATGAACISTDVAGGKAQIEHGVTGFIVPKRNVDAMRNAIKLLLDDNDMRDRLGKAAREHVIQDHSLIAMGKRWEHVYMDVLRKW